MLTVQIPSSSYLSLVHCTHFGSLHLFVLLTIVRLVPSSRDLEGSEQAKFLHHGIHAVWLTNLKGSVGLILAKTSVMWVLVNDFDYAFGNEGLGDKQKSKQYSMYLASCVFPRLGKSRILFQEECCRDN